METITIKDKEDEFKNEMEYYWEQRIKEYIQFKEQEWMYELEFKKIELEYKKENEQL